MSGGIGGGVESPATEGARKGLSEEASAAVDAVGDEDGPADGAGDSAGGTDAEVSEDEGVTQTSGFVPGSSDVRPPSGLQPFLRIPFSEPSVGSAQGWYYMKNAGTMLDCAYRGGDIAGYNRHCGVDWRTPRHETFAIEAAASGVAVRKGGPLNAIHVLHDVRSPSGESLCTRYLHSDPSRDVLLLGQKVRVAKGQKIAWAGKAGTSTVHLHFELWVGGCGTGRRVDPYDIAGGVLDRGSPPVRDYYPGNAQFTGCGPRRAMESCR